MNRSPLFFTSNQQPVEGETYKHTLLFQMVETVGFHTLLLSWRQSSAVEGLSKGFFRTLSLYLTLSLTKTLQDSVYISCNFNKCCPTCFYSWRRNSLLLSKSQTKGGRLWCSLCKQNWNSSVYTMNILKFKVKMHLCFEHFGKVDRITTATF